MCYTDKWWHEYNKASRKKSKKNETINIVVKLWQSYLCMFAKQFIWGHVQQIARTILIEKTKEFKKNSARNKENMANPYIQNSSFLSCNENHFQIKWKNMKSFFDSSLLLNWKLSIAYAIEEYLGKT